MDAVMMPVFAQDTPIDTAVKQMKASKRSGIIVTDGDTLWVIKAVNLLLGRRAGAKRLTDVRTREEVRGLTGTDVTRHGLELVDPRVTWQNYETLFSGLRNDYMWFGLAAVTEKRTVVETGVVGFTVIITSHESKKIELSTPSDCYCTGTQQHSFPPPSAKEGDPCPHGDGATVVCD